MHKLGIETGADLKSHDIAFLQLHFGKAGPYFYWIARGVDERQVKADRVRKSVGAEDTFSVDVHDFETAQAGLEPLIEKVWRYCEASGIRAKTATLKVKWATAPIENAAELAAVLTMLLSPLFPAPKSIRLLGVTLSSLEPAKLESASQFSFAL